MTVLARPAAIYPTRPVKRSCEHGNELSVQQKTTEFIGELGNINVNDSVPWITCVNVSISPLTIKIANK
jgi:hypothetical protein